MKTKTSLFLVAALMAVTVHAVPLNTSGRAQTSGTAETLEGHPASYFATATQGANADSALQSGISAVAGLSIATASGTLTLSGSSVPYASVAGSLAGGGNIITHNASEFASAGQGVKADSALQSGTSTVAGLSIATASGTLTLSGSSVPYASVAGSLAGGGNIVTHNVSEFASAAQGARADSSLQSGTSTVTGLSIATASGTLTLSGSSVPYASVAGSLASGGTATNVTLSGTTYGSIVRSGTTTGGTLQSPNVITPTGITKADVGLGNADNTSDVNKPISTATQTALDAKANMRVIQTGDFAALVNGRYTVNGTATVTDPGGTVAGQIYSVVIGSGTATIGSVAYKPSRIEVIRYYTGSAWTTLAPQVTDSLVLGGTANIANNQTLAGGTGSLMTQALSDARYFAQASSASASDATTGTSSSLVMTPLAAKQATQYLRYTSPVLSVPLISAQITTKTSGSGTIQATMSPQAGYWSGLLFRLVTTDSNAYAFASLCPVPYPIWTKSWATTWVIQRGGDFADGSSTHWLTLTYGAPSNSDHGILAAKGFSVKLLRTSAYISVHNGTSITSGTVTIPDQSQAPGAGGQNYYTESVTLLYVPGTEVRLLLSQNGTVTDCGAVSSGLIPTNPAYGGYGPYVTAELSSNGLGSSNQGWVEIHDLNFTFLP